MWCAYYQRRFDENEAAHRGLSADAAVAAGETRTGVRSYRQLDAFLAALVEPFESAPPIHPGVANEPKRIEIFASLFIEKRDDCFACATTWDDLKGKIEGQAQFARFDYHILGP